MGTAKTEISRMFMLVIFGGEGGGGRHFSGSGDEIVEWLEGEVAAAAQAEVASWTGRAEPGDMIDFGDGAVFALSKSCNDNKEK